MVLREKQRVYVDAARALGANGIRIMFQHVLPNSLSPYLVLVSVSIGSAIIGEASLSFLGAGVGANTRILGWNVVDGSRPSLRRVVDAGGGARASPSPLQCWASTFSPTPCGTRWTRGSGTGKLT